MVKFISESIRQGRILVSDGAWGTQLIEKGLGNGECPESWNLTHRNIVLSIAKAYVDAEADIIETNSFGANRIKLARYGLAEKTVELNTTAAAISREAAGRDQIVLGSIGPTGKMLMTGETTEEEMYEAFREQAMALEAGGADAICIETMSALDEALIAVSAVRANTRIEIACTFTFEKTAAAGYRTMMGVRPSNIVGPLIDAGADIIGTNCGNGMERMIQIVSELRALSSDIPILVHANAGLPVLVDGNTVFPETPEEMACFVPDLVRAGANVIGGCCGTTPEHIRALVRAVRSL